MPSPSYRSNGEPLRIHISHQCYIALEKLGGYQVEERGLITMKVGRWPKQR